MSLLKRLHSNAQRGSPFPAPPPLLCDPPPAPPIPGLLLLSANLTGSSLFAVGNANPLVPTQYTISKAPPSPSPTTPQTHTYTSPRCCSSYPLPRRPPHQLLQPQVLPADLLLPLGRALYAKRRVLVRHDVVFVFGIQRLVLR